MPIFISLFTHQGNQEWGVDAGDQVNTFFLLLTSEEEAGIAQAWKVLRWQGAPVGLGSGGALSPSPTVKAVPNGVLLSGTSSNLVSNGHPQSCDRKMQERLGNQPASLPHLVKGLLGSWSPAFHALSLSLPEEADPCSLPSPHSLPPVSICPPAFAPSGYVTTLFPLPAAFPWPSPPLAAPPGLGPPLSEPPCPHSSRRLPGRREQWRGELYLALGNRFTFPDLAF